MSPLSTLQAQPKIKHLEKRIKDTIEISLERTVAHFKNPGAYPLPADPKSVERAMYDLMKLLPGRKKKKFIEKYEAGLAAGAAKRKQLYGDLEAVDFKSSKSIAEQVKEKKVATNMLIDEADYTRYKTIIKQAAVKKPAIQTRKAISTVAAPAATAPGAKLVFTVTDMTCSRTSEVRKDEVSLGVFFIDATGTQVSVEPFFVGDFKKGDTISLGEAGKLADFDLGDSVGAEFPQTFIANMFLLEKDLLRDSEVLNKLQIVLIVAGPALLGVSSGCFIAAMATGFNPVLITLGFVTASTGVALMAIEKILEFISDDFSNSVSDILVFDAAPGVGEVFNRTANFSLFNALSGIGDTRAGKYAANIKWEVF
jgi:hypothetical protein